MEVTGTRRCPSCGREVAKRLTICPRCGADREGVGRVDDQPAVSGPVSTPPRSPLFRPSAQKGWSPEEYLVYGFGALLCVVLGVSLGLGNGLGFLELLLLTPFAVLSTLWLTIGVIAKGVEVGRRASRED